MPTVLDPTVSVDFLRPDETLEVSENSYSVKWYVDHFTTYSRDADCEYIYETLPEETKTEIDKEFRLRALKEKEGEILKQMEKLDEKIQKLRRLRVTVRITEGELTNLIGKVIETRKTIHKTLKTLATSDDKPVEEEEEEQQTVTLLEPFDLNF
jgi:septal ring factor EnvC (AmiA/AmiB activator)